MPGKVTLTVTKGKLAGEEFVFDERTTCIIGRAQDCALQVPDDKYHKTISRHHCLLDINPPDIRVRDFGSLNGTFVNGERIGQRADHQTPEEGAQLAFPEYDLRDGDRIELGSTTFQVSTYIPPSSVVATLRACASCGRDVTNEIGADRAGEFLCVACKLDPTEILSSILSNASGFAAMKNYEVLRELGKGGMGAVYLVRHKETGEQVALKMMLPKVAADEYAKQLFLREAQNTKALKHPHVVELFEYGFSNGTFFFTLEYCNGGSVEVLMKQRGSVLSIAEASQITLQALEGLDHAHNATIPCVKLSNGSIGRGRGLVHRDLSPNNIFLSNTNGNPVAKVGDYGLSKAFDLAGLSGQTFTGMAAGKPWFMSRQQVLNFRFAKPEVDVWAMAASLYFMLTGQFPRDFPTGRDRWQVVLQTPAVSVRMRNSAIPKPLAEVIDLALIDNPEIHFKTAAELKSALESVL